MTADEVVLLLAKRIRDSGLSGAEWCRQNDIPQVTQLYHVLAYRIPPTKRMLKALSITRKVQITYERLPRR